TPHGIPIRLEAIVMSQKSPCNVDVPLFPHPAFGHPLSMNPSPLPSPPLGGERGRRPGEGASPGSRVAMRENFSGKSLPARNSGERGETDENGLLSPALSSCFGE